MHVRRKLVAGNWKMNGTRAALGEIAAIAAAARETAGVDVALCPPFTLIPLAAPRAGGVAIGGQDCHQSPSGAHTGNVSAAMLVEAGAKLVIVGHSERRADQHEEDSLVRAKAEAALAAGLQTIVCVGEVEEERIAGSHVDKVLYQLEHSLPELAREAELVVAYEPVWAIGTGRTATPAQAQEVHAHIRKRLTEQYGAQVAQAVRIQYGGSVKPSNAEALMSQPDIDGALVGGASLEASDFIAIVKAARPS
ncbi:MAG: triose-phosphate isomerase [Alphaproteobacteria bacterium]|nr:triose-phosphate isomerase [Alphaproteobacteria bacterium]